MYSFIEKRGQGWEGEDWDSATRSLCCCHPLFTGESSIYQGLRTFSFFSLLFGADTDTQRDSTRNGSTVNYQRTPWAEIVLVHTAPCTFLSCSAVLYN